MLRCIVLRCRIVKSGHHRLLASKDFEDPTTWMTFDDDGDRLFRIACKAGHMRVITLLYNLLKESYYKPRQLTKPLTRACRKGSIELVRFLIEVVGAEIYSSPPPPIHPYSPLSIIFNALAVAAGAGQLGVVKYLV